MNQCTNDKTYVIGFSGGKDSVATWLYLSKTLELPNVVCTFSDTGHEADETYEYIECLRRDFGCPVVTIKPTLEDVRGELKPEKIADRLDIPHDDTLWNHPLNMETLAIVKRRFPSTMVRFCTTHLKLRPQVRWLSEHYPDLTNVIRVAGVRADESPSRAKRPEWTERDDMFDCPLWLPIHKWTPTQVFAKHAEYGVPPNPLYKEGMGRVGCWPCIMANKRELSAIAKRKPECFDNLAAMEKRVAKTVGKENMSFFSNTKTPPQYRSCLCPQSGEKFPVAEDVKLWALGEDPANSGQGMLFEEDWTEDAHQCLSQYGLCE